MDCVYRLQVNHLARCDYDWSSDIHDTNITKYKPRLSPAKPNVTFQSAQRTLSLAKAHQKYNLSFCLFKVYVQDCLDISILRIVWERYETHTSTQEACRSAIWICLSTCARLMDIVTYETRLFIRNPVLLPNPSVSLKPNFALDHWNPEWSSSDWTFAQITGRSLKTLLSTLQGSKSYHLDTWFSSLHHTTSTISLHWRQIPPDFVSGY